MTWRLRDLLRLGRSGEYWVVPAENGVPADLPPWARDELVERRVSDADLRSELLKYQFRAGHWRNEFDRVVRERDEVLVAHEKLDVAVSHEHGPEPV